MEEGIGSWYDYQQNNGQSSNFNILDAPYCMGQQSTSPFYMNSCNNFVSTNGIMPMHGSTGLPQVKADQPFQPHNWLYCLPRYRQAFTPVLNSASPYKNSRDAVASNAQSTPKRFLVFDQSGDQTTMMFSSGTGISGPVHNMPSWRPKPSNAFTPYKDLEIRKEAENLSKGYFYDGFSKQDYEIDVRSEMHEDTEELDALLYSDDENEYSEDEEEASTGHSPSILDNKRVWLHESGEEVSSSARPAKKHRVSGGDQDVPSLIETASSLKSDRCFEHEDKAESSCGNSNNLLEEEKIRKTISILKSIIPDGKGKDSIAVIDDAIQYLLSLKDSYLIGLDGQ
ncbi:transcription factor bHLH145-like [Apium graveolens]|uniref:transcription factor bHLH145-like n=1 Tax=Apium graveolens TaxID=4045 RepID=UPI003D7AED99